MSTARPSAPPNLVWVEAALLAEVSDELETAGLSPEAFLAGQPPVQGVLVVRGAARAEELAQHLIQVAVVAVVCPDELAFQSTAIADFILEGWRPGELSARVNRLRARDAPGYQVHLLARAVRYAGDIIELGTTGAVLQYVNPAYRRVLGFPPEEVVGKTPAELVRSDAHPPEFFRDIDKTLRSGGVWSGLLISKNAHGERVYLDTTIAPVADRQGKLTHHVAVKRDITDRVKREQALTETNRALRQARDVALEASRTKGEFLANMSHELRTPLNAIIGYSDLLMQDTAGSDHPTLHEDLERIRNAGSRLLDLINDVLDMSRIEAGQMKLDTQEFRLSDLVESVRDVVTPLARSSGNRFEWDVLLAPEVIRCDRQKLTQILVNLLGNACKFTNNGLILLEIERVHSGGLCLRVKDNGIGIAEDQHAQVFQAFVQADTTTTRRYGGSGLGLAISQRYCEMMGGRIQLQSRLGEGCCFSIWLPD